MNSIFQPCWGSQVRHISGCLISRKDIHTFAVIEQISEQRAATAAFGVHFDDVAAWSVLRNVKPS
jgi:hypothetical protein